MNFGILIGGTASGATMADVIAYLTANNYTKAQIDTITSSLSGDSSSRLAKASNLSDLTSTSTARTNLDVYSKAQVDAAIAAAGFKPTAQVENIAHGGTGQTTAAAAFAALKQDATTSATGVVQLATSGEAITGTDATKVITPQTMAAAVYNLSANVRNALRPRGGVAFYGSASTRITTPLAEQIIGTDPFSVSFVLTVPYSNTGSERGFLILGPQYDTISGSNSQFYGTIESNGTLAFYVSGPGGTGDNNKAALASFRSTYAGKTVVVTAVRPASGSLVVYINGEAVTVTYTSAGTPPTWQGSITANYFTAGCVISGTSYDGAIRSVSLYNLALSAAEAKEIYEMGGDVHFRYRFGSQVPRRSSDFSATSDSLTGGDGTVTWAGNVDQDADGAGVPPSDNWARATRGATGQMYHGWIKSPGAHAFGKVYRFKGDVFLPSDSPTPLTKWGVASVYNAGAGPLDRFSINLALGSTASFDGLIQNLGESGSSFIMGPHSAGAGVLYYNSIAAGEKYYVKNFVEWQVGAIVHWNLEDGLGFILLDSTPNRKHGAMIGNVTHVSPQIGPAHVRRSSATNGNEQLFGQVCIPANAQILRVRARSRTGTPTVTLGTSSGGSQVVASVALSTSWKDLTIALTGGMVGGSNISLWAGSNSTDVVDWDITWEPLSE